MIRISRFVLPVFVVGVFSLAAHAEDSPAELAKKLSNPIAALISLPMQGNYDKDIGAANGERYTVNVQPVIPISINDEWNVISRTILPLTHQYDVVPGDSEQEGTGDVTQSLFFSPKALTENGWVVGFGPAFLLPTASEKYLGTEKWGVGPTAVVLKQANGWTYGALANQINSVAGEDKRDDISSTFLQPFLSYTTSTYTTFTLNTESTYDWKAEEWAVPVNFAVAQLFKVGKQPMQLQAGVRYWADTTPTSPEGWGVRLSYTLLFPK